MRFDNNSQDWKLFMTASNQPLIRRIGTFALVAVAAIALTTMPAHSQRGWKPPRPCRSVGDPSLLPPLRTVQTAVIGPSYSCGGTYSTAALYVTEENRRLELPDLLFNGACGSENNFDLNLAGDEMSLIADLGTTPLAVLDAANVFNLRGVDTFADYTKFAWTAKIVEGHTYAVVLNSGVTRGVFVFTVTRFVPDKQVALQYEVLSYAY
jgi:hypothetical protein